MIHDDYLMRMIEEFINALIRLLLNKKREQQAISAELGELATRFLGLDLSLLRSLPAGDIEQLFTASGEPDYLKYYMAAELLREESVDPAARNEDEFRKAVRLYRSALPLLKNLESAEITNRLAGLIHGIDLDRLSPDLLIDLFHIQRQAGDADAAVAILETLRNRQGPDHISGMRSVYDALLQGTDEELLKIGLDREEIIIRRDRLTEE